MINKIIFVNKKKDLLTSLSELPGAIASHREASFGYSFELKDGSTLIIGQTDEDVSDKHILWFQYYKE